MVKNWEEIVVAPNVSILEAWRVLDAAGLRILLVVAENKRLIGVATDGDIRRGLLNGGRMEDSIVSVSNSDPFTVSPGNSKEQLIKIMEERGILAIPVVDCGVLVGVEILHDLLFVPKKDNPVFLMAGGFGTRLRPLTDSCPKPMLKIGGRPMLEILINGFKRAGFHNFYISTHYLPEVIEEYFGCGRDWGVSITYVHEDTPLGTGGALGLLPDSVSSDLPLIVMNGDILTNINYERLLNFHNSNGADATMCVREYEYKIPYGVVNSDGVRVVGMEEKPTKRFSVNAGIYVVSPDVVRSVSENSKVDLPVLLEKRISADKKVVMFPVHEYWLDIGRMDDFNQAQSDIASLGI